jgi:hypothetical protein
VRALRDTGHPTAHVLKRGLDAYIRWAERDGAYERKRYVPVIATAAIQRGEGEQKSRLITAEMQFLAERYRELRVCVDEDGGGGGDGGDGVCYSAPPPLVYGLLFMGLKGIVLTLDPALGAHVEPRVHSVYDWSGTGMDVWNGLAMAIVVVTARNAIVAQARRGELDDSEAEDVDVDA